MDWLFYVIIAVIIQSFYILIIKYFSDFFIPESELLMLISIGLITLTIINYIKKINFLKILKKHYKNQISSSFCWTIGTILLFYAIKSVNNPGSVSSLAKLQIIVTYLFSLIFLKQVVFKTKVFITLIIITFGGYLVCNSENKTLPNKNNYWMFFIFFAIIFLSGYQILTKRGLNKSNNKSNPIGWTMCVYILIFLYLIIINFLKNGRLITTTSNIQYKNINLKAGILFIVISLLIPISRSLLIKATELVLNPTYIIASLSLIPIIVSIISLFIFNKSKFLITHFIGIGIMITGIILLMLYSKKTIIIKNNKENVTKNNHNNFHSLVVSHHII